MKDQKLWLQFGCFLTGYNYSILSNCSEVAAKTVKKYTSALIIISVLWAFVGYSFTNRYLKMEALGSIVGAAVFVIIIIQVEKQIILTFGKKNNGLAFFRIIIAIAMAILGSIIIDQIIFKEDIEQKQIMLIDDKIDKILPAKSKELQFQIKELDNSINNKEEEWSRLSDEISRNPTIKVYSVTSTKSQVPEVEQDSLGRSKKVTKDITTTSTNMNSAPNPKIALSESLNEQMKYLRSQKAEKDKELLTLRPSIEKEIKSKVGFLDELNVMFSLLKDSVPASIVYALWFFLLLGLELFILFSKRASEDSDYDTLILHQMNTNKKKIELLSKRNADALEPI